MRTSKEYIDGLQKMNKNVYAPQRLYNRATEFFVVKAPDTIRIFILGGSIVENWGSRDYGNYLEDFENILEDLIPGKDFEAINCGMGAYDSYRISLVEKEILSYQPDIIMA